MGPRSRARSGPRRATGYSSYELPDEVWERVHAGELPNLYRGSVELEDGRVVPGILYPRELAQGHHRETTEYGDWRVYWAARRKEQEGED